MKIFISYRRDDSADATGRLYDRLEQHYDPADVFMDVDTIPLGVDFRKHLSDAVSKCDVLLAIIGERWCGPVGSGERRIDDPRDFVRIEVESALTRDIPVIPVLVGSANMPAHSELPDSLKDLAFRNAAELRSGRYFKQQLDHLIHGLERLAQLAAAHAPPTPLPPSSPSQFIKCPYCHFDNEDGSLFCEQCKSDLASAPPPPPNPPTPAPSAPLAASSSAALEVFCPQCKCALTVDRMHLDRQVQCPFCRTVFQPNAAASSVAAPVAAPASTCFACGGVRLPGAISCMDCGFLFDATGAEPESANLCPNPACGVANSPSEIHCQRCGVQLPTAAGTLIDNRYRIEKLLAMGGFGSVYRAADTQAGDAPVVVKEMLCSDPKEFSLRLNFFRREAEILGLLAEAPAVPRFYDLVEQAENAYLVMEFVQGKDLLRILEENGNQPFPLDQVIGWGIAICDVLRLMHAFNPPWVHRDLKPDNVLLKDDGTIKLVDFGTSRSLGMRDKADRGDVKTDKKTRVYTEGYAPPEQIVGHPEPRSDIFALAGMLYHVATGKAPEGFYTAKELQAQLENGAFPAKDRWFYELLRINLAEDANDRYYSVRWLKADLENRKVSKGIVCPKCKKVNKLRTPYCLDCQTPLTPKMPPCVHCGTVNRMGSPYCIKCDNRVRW